MPAVTRPLSTFHPPALTQPQAGARLLCLVLLTTLCWLVCTIAQLEKYLPLHLAVAVATAGVVVLVFGMLALRRSYAASRDTPLWPVLTAVALLVLAFAVLYPKSQHRPPNMGSDREDALRVELVAVTHHRYPYDARTYLHDPPTPLPGAFWIAAPFFFAGRVALQNLLWIGLFTAVLLRYFRSRLTVAAYLAVFLLTALENLNDFVVGGDYVTNILYIAVALFLIDRALTLRTVPESFWRTALPFLFFGIAISSRILYVLFLIPVFALSLQRLQWPRAVLLNSLSVITAVAVTLPIFVPHPVPRFLAQLSQNADKLRHLPPWLPAPLLPVLAIAIALSAFFLHLDLARVYLLGGLIATVLILPPMATIVAASSGLFHPMTTDLEYLAAAALLLGLWIFARWEQLSLSGPLPSAP